MGAGEDRTELDQGGRAQGESGRAFEGDREQRDQEGAVGDEGNGRQPLGQGDHGQHGEHDDRLAPAPHER